MILRIFICLCLVCVTKTQRRFYTSNAEYEFYIHPNTKRLEIPSSLRVDQHGPLFETRPSHDNRYDPDYEPLPPPSGSDWTQWTEWSFCSRSCGGGVSMRTRRCGLRTLNDITRDCAGSDIQHKTCNTEPCLETEASDFRTLQCLQHDDRQVFSSTQFKWTPYYGTDVEPCQLSCMAVGFNFYKSFGPVQDGTRCWRDKHDMCIEGRCLKVGCDQILGSNKTEDACGMCGGDNSTCFHYSNTFAQLATDAVNFDYSEVARIPAGATHIRITDDTDNYLALMEAGSKNVKYVVNGNWVISWPGDFVAAGTVVKYDRSGTKESLVAAGPTTSDIHIMMLYLGEPAHVEYDYWIPYGLRPGQVGEFKLGVKVEQVKDEDYYDNLYQDWDVMETTTKRTTTTTATTTTSTTTTTTTPTTAQTSYRKMIKKRPKPAYCTPCKRPRNRKKHYCQSDFVIHARVSSKNKVEGKRYRHDIKINSVYKSSFKLMEREYLWVYSSCCPKLRPFREYLIMGRKRKVEIGPDGRGVWQTPENGTSTYSGKKRRFETRLVVDHMDYWHVWKRKYERGMNKFSKKTKCRNIASSAPPSLLRDPERRSVSRRGRRRIRH